MPSAFAEKVPPSRARPYRVAPAARTCSPLAGVLNDRALDSAPFEADPLDAEIVLGLDLEAERLGIEHDLLPGHVFAGQGRRLIVAAVIASVNGSLPARPNLSCQRNSIVRGRQPCGVGLETVGPAGGRALAVDLWRWTAPGWRSRRIAPGFL